MNSKLWVVFGLATLLALGSCSDPERDYSDEVLDDGSTTAHSDGSLDSRCLGGYSYPTSSGNSQYGEVQAEVQFGPGAAPSIQVFPQTAQTKLYAFSVQDPRVQTIWEIRLLSEAANYAEMGQLTSSFNFGEAPTGAFLSQTSLTSLESGRQYLYNAVFVVYVPNGKTGNHVLADCFDYFKKP